jgi:hypothetical protein
MRPSPVRHADVCEAPSACCESMPSFLAYQRGSTCAKAPRSSASRSATCKPRDAAIRAYPEVTCIVVADGEHGVTIKARTLGEGLHRLRAHARQAQTGAEPEITIWLGMEREHPLPRQTVGTAAIDHVVIQAAQPGSFTDHRRPA